MYHELIYHTTQATGEAISPFATAWQEVIRGPEPWIACPYLDLCHLERMLNSATDWRLLTDLWEWMSICSHRTRPDVCEWITRHAEHIRDLPGLHAKVAVSGNGAVVGSANLTQYGLCRRHEMAVRLRDDEDIRCIRQWFDSCWNDRDARVVARAALDRVAREAPAHDGLSQGLNAKRQPRRLARLAASGERNETLSLSAPEAELIRRLRLLKDWACAAAFLEWAGDLLDITGLREGDERLTMTMPPSERTLTVHLNDRYALATRTTVKPTVWLMVTAKGAAYLEEEAPELAVKIHHFSGANAPKAAVVCFPLPPRHQGSLRNAWTEAITAESSTFRRKSPKAKHVPVLYRAAADRRYRAAVLNAAYSSSPEP